MFGYSAGVDLSASDVARLRRSIAMLSAGCPSALDRESALAVLMEMERLQTRDRDFQRLVSALRRLVDAADGGAP